MILHMFPKRGWIGVSLLTSGNRTHVGFSVQVRPLVFGSVRRVGEGLHAVRVYADVRPLPGVAAQVDFEILQARESLAASLERAFVGLLSGVDSHVNKELVPGVEGPVSPLTRRPETSEVIALPLVYVRLLDVPGKRFPRLEQDVAVHPPAKTRTVVIRGTVRTAFLCFLMVKVLLVGRSRLSFVWFALWF